MSRGRTGRVWTHKWYVWSRRCELVKVHLHLCVTVSDFLKKFRLLQRIKRKLGGEEGTSEGVGVMKDEDLKLPIEPLIFPFFLGKRIKKKDWILTLMMDVTMTHDRFGCSTQCTNGTLTHRVSSTGTPQSDGALKNASSKKIHHYRQLYVDKTDPVIFLFVVVNTSGHIYQDFVRLLFLHIDFDQGFSNESYYSNRFV